MTVSSIFNLIALLVTLAAVFGYINHRWVRLPHTIGLVVIALAVSMGILLADAVFPEFGLGATVRGVLTEIDFEDTLMTGMLSFLLFAGALHVDLDGLLRRRWAIAILASVGIMTSTLIVSGVMFLGFRAFGFEMPLTYCLVFGALISPTDPVAVMGILKDVKVPETLEAKIAGESLFNDGVGVVHGEFNWSSQHLDDEVLRCRDGNGDGQTGRVGLRCVRLVGRRQRGVRSSNGSGRRSRGGCRVRMPLCPVACRRPWVVVGSVRAVVCRRSAWRPDRLATCPLRSGKRSRSCELRAPGCATLPVGSVEPRRLSHVSCVATRRLGAAVWRIGRRLRSGTATDVPSARR